MSKRRQQPDVLILGSHPSCYLAAAVLQELGVKTVHATIPDSETCDRLMLVNPKFFTLHKLTAALKTPALAPVQGLRFLADDPATSSEYLCKSAVGYIGGFQQLRSEMVRQAKRAKIEMIESSTLAIHGADEQGVDVHINENPIRPKMLIVGGDLPPAQRKILGLPDVWERGVVQRYTYLRLKGHKCLANDSATTIPMSLNLGGKSYWGWLLRGVEQVQIAVSQPIESIQKIAPYQLLAKWIETLTNHQVLKPPGKTTGKSAANPLDPAAADFVDLPLAGAMAQEGVGNRTLLIGPAGGFYTACAEDLYPNCWSALFAADVAAKALKQPHLQDALGDYRQTWGTTLGDYLRGPQDNLRFLLPLVYRNPVMTARIGEAILCGESVVR